MSTLAIDGGAPVRERFLVFGQPTIGDEEIAEVVATLKSRWLGTGPKTIQFEKDFAAYVGADEAFAVNSCTSALHLALLMSGVGPGDEVLVPALTFAATANVVVHCGARPVFVDVDAGTLNLDLADVERKITSRTRAVMAVHFAGLPVDLASLQRLAQEHRLSVAEDAAHAVGAAIDGRRIGGWGNLTSFSFYANKNMTTGEGGMLTTAPLTEEARHRLLGLRLHGLTHDAWKRFHTKQFVHTQVCEAGFKYNMTDLQSSIGMHQLRKVEDFLARREAVAAEYRRGLSGLPVRFQSIPTSYGKLRHGLHLFVLLLDPAAFTASRDEIVAALRAENIGATVHYTALPLEPFYASLTPQAIGSCPRAVDLSRHILSLPIGPEFSRDDVADVVEAVHKVLGHYRR